MGLPNISERKFIRWLPNEPSEPTSTLVLTSAQSRFVDIRISKDSALGSLEWAFAGTSSSQPAHEENGREMPAHSTWTHWVDSRVLRSHAAPVDEGDMYPQPNGDVLEKGRMAHPITGILTEYEELWGDLEIKKISEGPARVSLVLTADDYERSTTGMVVRVGQWCQGVLRMGDKFSAERWWHGRDPSDGVVTWKRIFKVGTGEMPFASTFAPSDLSVGNIVTSGETRWTVNEIFEW